MIRLQPKGTDNAKEPSRNDQSLNPSSVGVSHVDNLDPTLTETVVRPIFMGNGSDEILDVKTAANHADRSDKTIRRWCKQFGIGRQVGPNSPLQISRIGLEMVLNSDLKALDLLQRGQRSHPDVLMYFEWSRAYPLKNACREGMR